MADTTVDEQKSRAPILDRTVDLTNVSLSTISGVVILLIAVALRLAQLDHNALSNTEAHLAGDAYRFYTGDTNGPGNHLSRVAPAALLLQSLSFFLFGTSDLTARLAPALLGIAMVVMALGLRPVIGSARALGAAAFLALSPVMVFSSRTASREIFVSAFALFALVAFTRIGLAGQSRDGRRRWALFLGAGLAALFGSGPSSLSVLFIMLLSATFATVLDADAGNAVRRSLAALRSTKDALIFAGAGFAITIATLFSHIYTDFSALAGLGETFAGWGRLLTTASSSTPTQFFLLAILLYEILAVVFAFVAVSRAPEDNRSGVSWSMFAIWFAISLVVFSFSSGSAPEHAIHVALPLLLLGGGAFGELIDGLDPRDLARGRLGLLVLILVGLAIAILAELVLLGRIDSAVDQGQATFEAFATIFIAIGPLAVAAVMLAKSEPAEKRAATITAAALLAISVFLGAYTVRSSILLGFFNAGGQIELLAQRTSTPAVRQIVHRITNLARDMTLADGSARDPEGGHGLSIAIDKSIQWPYRWYFREFPDAIVVSEGGVALSGADVVIAPDDAGLADAGYGVHDFPTTNRVPAPYLAPEFGNILRSIFFPNRWEDGARFLLFRTLSTTAEPETVTLGLAGELANQVTPKTGPFGLYEKAGAGNGRGQFNQPRGVAVSSDGEQIYVVDMGNARVEHFDALGTFIDDWGGPEDPEISLARTDSGLGPTGIAVGPDGLIYVCDTWNHRILVLNQSGHLVHEFGSFADTHDATDAAPEPGLFFGPRAIAIYNNEIFVVDTGNERVQVFDLDGTLVRAWGGFGSSASLFIEPVGIAISPDGRVFVADSGNARISIFSSTGTPLEQWPVDAWAGNQYFEPYLAFDDAGFLYASSSATGSVEVFDLSGEVIISIRQVGNDQLEQPVGLAWSPEGSMLISDRGKHAIYRYTPPTPPELIEESEEFLEGASPEVASPGNGDESAELSSLHASPVASPMASPVASPFASPIAGGNG